MNAPTARSLLFRRSKSAPAPRPLDPADMGAEYGLNLRMERQAEEALQAPPIPARSGSGIGWMAMLRRRA
ncbi:hypothetical protein [Aquincola sp. J276]|uniref:hypothetical protein n=1 Tax=Aquincola sp. J276 TaxID=2898432 RepID=UPI002151E536|nr:hypothetical protein [Aquincola sp. J276]MCR5865969.1 hypothetical protein [Aquincola sp. J276]